MLDFILSKLNLLILVTAIFAIISFFAIGLGDITKIKEANELASRVKEKTDSVANSNSYCDATFYPFPNDLRTAGGKFYYVMKISKTDIESSTNPVNVLIFSVYRREDMRKEKVTQSDYKAKAIAADSFRTTAAIKLYGTQYEGTGYSGSPVEADEVFIDPQAENPMNGIDVIKEVQDGKLSVYIIGCESSLCSAYKTEIGKQVHGTEGGFFC